MVVYRRSGSLNQISCEPAACRWNLRPSSFSRFTISRYVSQGADPSSRYDKRIIEPIKRLRQTSLGCMVSCRSRFEEFLSYVASNLQRLLNRPTLGDQALDIVTRGQREAFWKFFNVQRDNVFRVGSLGLGEPSQQAARHRVSKRGESLSPQSVSAAINVPRTRSAAARKTVGFSLFR